MSDSSSLARRLPILLTLVALGALARPAAAQVFEIGAGVSRACTGDSSGFCSDETGAMWALHGGLWVSRRWLINLRVATLPLPDATHSTPRDERFDRVTDPAVRVLPRIDITSRHRSRQLIGGEGLYHFAGPRRFGAVLGVGIGEVRNPMTLSCEPDGCEEVMRALGDRPGRLGSRGVGNLTFIAGVSAPAGSRVRISGGVRFHNFAGEGLSTTEAYAATGFRLGSF